MTILYIMTPKNAKVRLAESRNQVVNSDSRSSRHIGRDSDRDAGKYFHEIRRFHRIIRSTVKHSHRTKSLDIINGSDFNNCAKTLEELSEKLRMLYALLDADVRASAVFADDGCLPTSNASRKAFESLFEINNELSLLFRTLNPIILQRYYLFGEML